jgi:hypothetical protein
VDIGYFEKLVPTTLRAPYRSTKQIVTFTIGLATQTFAAFSTSDVGGEVNLMFAEFIFDPEANPAADDATNASNITTSLTNPEIFTRSGSDVIRLDFIVRIQN